MAARLIPAAILYDFDGTLSPINMQEHEFIPQLGFSSSDAFWVEVKALAREQDCCEILAYMHTMLREAQHKKIPVSKDFIKNYGKGLKLFPGVEEWFDRQNKFAKSLGVRLEHYVISSGVKPLIEGTSIAKEFKRIYACDFIYDADGKPIAPGVAVDYTSKTQYIFRINKGTLDQWDNRMINEYVEMKERPTPIENMIFIGDGSTDIPAMKMTNHYGGMSIAVYNSKKRGKKDYAKQLVLDGRANCAVSADYSDEKDLDKIVRLRLEEVAASSRRKRLTEKLQ
ncbi:HAD family hydrolase [Litorimonas sp. WD9-15]|uniref:HAD family hydrolase n=1 Tax=Litorimonas sp. WD9-15 TaxID=3418716 RepID=UPI003CFD5EE2